MVSTVGDGSILRLSGRRFLHSRRIALLNQTVPPRSSTHFSRLLLHKLELIWGNKLSLKTQENLEEEEETVNPSFLERERLRIQVSLFRFALTLLSGSF